MYPVVDKFLSFPTPVILVLAVLLWAAIAVFVNLVVVPILCGRDGKKLGKFEAEVTSQIALASIVFAVSMPLHMPGVILEGASRQASRAHGRIHEANSQAQYFL